MMVLTSDFVIKTRNAAVSSSLHLKACAVL